MAERIQQARWTYRTYSANWSRMPWRIRAVAGLVGVAGGWLAYVLMAAGTHVASSDRLDRGLPVLSITVILVVNLMSQFAGAWWWTARRTGLPRRRP